MRWELTERERDQLQRDCRESGVPAAVEDPATIKKVIALITKAGK
jgi:hypothetical protein